MKRAVDIVLLWMILPTRLATSAASITATTTTTTTTTVDMIRGVRSLQVQVASDGSGISSTTTTTTGGNCNFAGQIRLSNPLSIDPVTGGELFSKAFPMHLATAMTVDHINAHRCGVHIQGQNYSLVLRTMGDGSDPAQALAAGLAMVHETDFFLAPYSSHLTAAMAHVAQNHSKIMLSSGASASDIFHDDTHNGYTFGMLPHPDQYINPVLQTFADQGAKTVALVSEYAEYLQLYNQSFVRKFGLELIDSIYIELFPNSTVLDQVAQTLARSNPDLVFVHLLQTEDCPRWIQSLQRANWMPRANAFTNCIQSDGLLHALGPHDLAFASGVAVWHPSNHNTTPDPVTHWTPQEFTQRFLATAMWMESPTYQAAAASAAVSILVQAMERADTYQDTHLIRHVLATLSFDTVFGTVQFDHGHQNSMSTLLLQYDHAGTLHVVGPTSVRHVPPDHHNNNNNNNNNKTTTTTDNFTLVYPSPSWEYRACQYHDYCFATGGTACNNPKGDCACPQSLYSIGVGSNAHCIAKVQEDKNYLKDNVRHVGMALVAIQAALSIFFVGWVIRYRSKPVVKVSQPFFLILIALGCLVCACSILPRAMEGDYRYRQDPITGELLMDEPNPNIGLVDQSCMAWIWLFALGFAIIFSALFAKIWRLKKIVDSAMRLRRQTVMIQDVMYIMIIMMAGFTTVLLTWQLVDPLYWQRTVLQRDQDGFPTRSVGRCQPQNEYSIYAFMLPLLLFMVGCLLYALYLSFVTRKCQMGEAVWITASVFSIGQLLFLFVPVLFLINDDTDAFFFVYAGFVFLTSTTITLLMFVPKFHALHFAKAGKIESLSMHISGLHPSSRMGPPSGFQHQVQIANVSGEVTLFGSSRHPLPNASPMDPLGSSSERLGLDMDPPPPIQPSHTDPPISMHTQSAPPCLGLASEVEIVKAPPRILRVVPPAGEMEYASSTQTESLPDGERPPSP